MRVELALTPDSRWPLPFAEVIEATRAAGFTSLGVPRPNATPETAEEFAAAGLRCHETMSLMVTADGKGTISFAQRIAEAASVMGATWVNTLFRPELVLDIAVLQRCAAIFAEAGAAMAVEFSPMGTVTSLAHALDVVAAIGPDKAGVQIDSWHFAFGPSTWVDLETLPVDQIAYVQFSDAPPLESDDLISETMTRRTMPGNGSLDLDRFATTLLERGWAGTVSLEVLNPELADPSVPAFIERAYRSSVGYWR